MADSVETGPDITLQNPLGRMLPCEGVAALLDGIRGGTLRTDARGVRIAQRLRDGIQGQQVQGLPRPVMHRGDRQRALAMRALALRNVDAPERERAIASWQGTNLPPASRLHCLPKTRLEPPQRPVDGIPVNGVPGPRASGECPRQWCHRCHLPALVQGLAKRSCDERPEGRLLACAWDHVASPLNPYPSHDRMAFASSLLPLPHAYRLPLRLAFPRGRRTGLPCSVSGTYAWGRRALSTGSVEAHDKAQGRPGARSVAIVAQAFQHLGLVLCDGVYQACTWVRPTIHPRPVSVVMLTETSAPHGYDASRVTVGALSEGSVQIVAFLHIFVGYR